MTDLLNKAGLSGWEIILALVVMYLFRMITKNHKECVDDRKRLWEEQDVHKRKIEKLEGENEDLKEIKSHLKAKALLPCEKEDCPKRKESYSID